MSGSRKRGKYEKPLSVDMDFGEALERFAQTKPEEVEEEAAKGQALRLVQRDDGGDSFLIYATDRGIKTELRFDGDSPWFTQAQLGEIFGVKKQSVSDHVNKFIEDGELGDSVVREFRTTAADGKAYPTLHYSLDAAFYVGYRVNSTQGILFRKWATAILIQIAKHGYYIDKERLKEPDDLGIIDKVRTDLYEVRAATANAYREVKRIVANCQDYDGSQKAARDFFARVENKLLFAATGRTAPEIIKERADASEPNMGLTYYTGKNGPIKGNVTVGNNYLYPDEGERKNHITVMLLDYFIAQADQGRLVTMEECERKVVEFIRFNQWELLTNAGTVSRADADAHALAEYERFKRGGVAAPAEPKTLPKPKKKG